MNHDCTWSQPHSASDLFTFGLIPLIIYSCNSWQILVYRSCITIFMVQLARDCECFGVIFFVIQFVTIVTHRARSSC